MNIDLSPSVVAVISLGITSLTGALMAWIAYKQATLSKTVLTLEQNTNSIKDALVASTAKASHAEGKLAGAKEEAARQKL